VNRGVARRYARALADIVFAAKLPPGKRRPEVEKSRKQLAQFSALLREHPALRNTLASPAVKPEAKLAVLDQLRSRLRLSELTRNFLAVLLDNRRLGLIEQVVDLFDSEVYARLGIVPVEVTSAVDLGKKQKNSLEKRLAALTGSEVEMRFRQSPDILAGLVARLGSVIYDASLRAQLRRLQRQLTAESR
jgi:F-type H+-transporting ATPase subunit delta